MSSQLKVNSIRDTSNNEALTISSGNVSFNNTISAGTIGDNVTFPSGHIIQVVHDELATGITSTAATNGQTISGTDMTINISSSSHYVYVIIGFTSFRTSSGSIHHQYLTLNGGGFGTGYNSNPSMHSLLQAAVHIYSSQNEREASTHARLDTNPGGTSVTYSLHGHPQNDGGGTVSISYNNINYTLMEIMP